MEQAGTWLTYVTDAVFVALALATFRQWWTRRDAAGLWLFATFGTLALVTLAGLVLPKQPHSDLAIVVSRVDLIVLVTFPYLLFRFATSFGEPPARWIRAAAATLTGATIVLTAVLPPFPQPGDPQPWWFVAFLVVFLTQWASLLMYVAGRLWLGGRGQGSVAKRRMRSLAAASSLMALALIVAGLSAGSAATDRIALITNALALASALGFYVAFAPPKALRVLWRIPEQEATREATFGLVGITQVEEIEVGFLPHVSDLVGARAVSLVRDDGTVIASYGLTRDETAAALRTSVDDDTMLGVAFPFGQMVVWAGPYTPFFGQDEISLLRSMGSIVDLALERCDLIARQLKTTEHLAHVNQLKNEFVAIVAHDLRSPMTVISGFAKTIHNQWDVLDDDRKLMMLEMISRNTDNLATLVEDVLQVARIESGDFHYEIAPFDMAALVRQTIADLQAAHPDRYELSLDPDEYVVLGDQDRNWQVLTNLLNNAAKFSPPDAPIRVRVEHVTDAVCVSVEDRGIGISERDLPRIFDKFTRIDPKQGTAPVKGTGLGLYICKSMIEAQGGKIWVTSQPDVGSTFTYTVPRPPVEAFS